MAIGATVRALYRRRLNTPGARPLSRYLGTQQRADLFDLAVPTRTRRRADHVPPAPRPRTRCPLTLHQLLGLDGDARVAVLDGELHACVRSRAGAYRLEHRGNLAARLHDMVEERAASLRIWASRTLNGVDSEMCPTPPAADAPVIRAFIDERLIPALATHETGVADPSIPRPEVCLPDMGRWFAVGWGEWLELAPFQGDAHGHLVFRFDDQEFAVVKRTPWRDALRTRGAELESTLSRALVGEDGTIGRALYRGATHSVVQATDDLWLCARRIAPYAVQGRDGRLFRFGAVDIGIALTGTDTPQVLGHMCVRALHRYPHMFIASSVTNIVCMPQPLGYYEELYQLPLEQALIAHLEAARMALCAGYGPLNSDVHPIEILDLPVLGEAEAFRQGLPVYPYPGRLEPRSRG